MAPAELHRQISHALQTGGLEQAGHMLAGAPHDPNFSMLRGIHAQLQGDNTAAVQHFESALAARPGWPEAAQNLAQTQLRLGQATQAIEGLRHLAAQQQLAPAYILLADAYEQTKDQASANQALEQAIALGVKDSEVISNYWLGRRKLCDWSQPLPSFSVSDITPAAAAVFSESCAFQRQVAETWCRTRMPRPAPTPARPPNDGARRWRIGYLSCDVHHHATAYLIAELFALHDRNAFEAFCFSYGPADNSAIRQRIQASCEHFVDLHGASTPAALQALKDAKLDALIDLKGHTRGHALHLLSQRPAPLQIHYLGHPGTIGAPFIDYLVGDNIVTPPGCDEDYSEKLLRHPVCYQINDRVRPMATPKSRAEYGLPEDAVVLACFNQTYKVTPEVFGDWCDILKARDNAVLWLYSAVPGAAQNLHMTMQQRGLETSRLIVAGPVANDQHLARYQAADIVLDTYPYGSHTTASDALWAGTPIVARCGATYPSRVAASLLNAIGLPQLAISDRTDYIKRVIDLIDNPAERAELRRYLQQARTSSQLFDTPAWVRDWETILKGVLV